MKIEYHKSIKTELQQIMGYYDKLYDGFGNEFLSEFEQNIFYISSNPKMYMKIKNNMRKALLKRFPYVIYFKQKKEIIRVLVLKHQRRHPSYGLNRK